ncbi:MAG: NTP transferase domain-containing protein [Cryomorphaceae bacterium]|nr:NTP transferase domain-containing protein [Cryomorphaceae bacterium]
MGRHAGLEKPLRGKFGNVDIGFFGSDCDHIRAVCAKIAREIQHSTTYVDADHTAFDAPDFCNRSDAAFRQEIIDQGLQSSLHIDLSISDLSSIVNHRTNIAFVNANHFETAQTVWIWNQKKEASVRKRHLQRKNCKIIVATDIENIPLDLRNEFSADIQIVHPDDDRLPQIVASLYTPPPIYGLVLAGGKSTRMGYDKTRIAHHGKPQYQHAFEMLSGLCEKTFLSVGSENNDKQLPALVDRFIDFGPFGAILTAFATHPNAAWLVLASDMPLVDRHHLSELLSNRSLAHNATAFLNPITGFADPLCALYEPNIYPDLLHFLSKGYSCPRKVLINTPTHLIAPTDPQKLFNLNTPEDLEKLNLKDGQ